MIIVTGSIVAQDGKLEETLALSLAHVRRSRAESGCISHAVHQDAENASRLVFIEEWKDQAALAAHFAVAASRSFVKAVTALSIEAPKMSIFEASKLQG